jgi:hypothetical protein
LAPAVLHVRGLSIAGAALAALAHAQTVKSTLRRARSSADDHHIRIGWLAGLLGAKPKSLAMQLRPCKSLEWSDDETFVRAVQRMVQEAEREHRAVINRLIRQDRLEKGSRKELKLRTQVYVHDARRKPSQLPLVPGVRLRPIR